MADSSLDDFSCVSAKLGKRQRAKKAEAAATVAPPPLPAAPPIPPGEYADVYPGEVPARFAGPCFNQRMCFVEIEGVKTTAFYRPGTRITRGRIIGARPEGAKWRIVARFNFFGKRVDRPAPTTSLVNETTATLA